MMTLFNQLFKRQFSLFLIVGLFNTLIGYSLFDIFIALKLHYTEAVLLSTCLGVLINFNTTGNIVFKNKNKKLIFYFIGIYILLYGINIFLIHTLLLLLHNLYFVGAIATLLMAGISFYLNKRFVFKVV